MRHGHNKSSVLIITLWALVILTVFVIGIARRSAIDLRISTYQRDKLKCTFLGRAGVKKAIRIIKNGVEPDHPDPQSLYSQQWPGMGSLRIGNIDPSGGFIWGLADEERRVNLNGLGVLNTKSLIKGLLTQKNIADAEAIADLLQDWTDPDAEVDKPFYKNAPLERIEELVAVLEYFYFDRGIAADEARRLGREAYVSLKDDITVYTEAVNINTAPENILRVLSRAAAGSSGKGEVEADNLAWKLSDRAASGGFVDEQALSDFTTGDPALDELWDYLRDSGAIAIHPRSWRFGVFSLANGVTKNITVVYNDEENTDDGRMVYWHEN